MGSQKGGHKRTASDISQEADDSYSVPRHPTTKRAKEIDAHTPLNELDELLQQQKSEHPVRNVLHWFRSKDIRQEDNKALHAAGIKAKEGKGVLLAMYLHSPKDLEWHGTSPARSDFLLQSLAILRDQLREKNIPLAIVVAEERKEKSDKVLQFIRDNDVSHVFANYEYEVDELRRDIDVVESLKGEKELSLALFHDQTVVEPGSITTGTGGPHKVFTPFHKLWLAKVAESPELLDLVPPPEGNDKGAVAKYKALFDTPLPTLPENKQFKSEEDKERIRKLWPPGHEAGIARLEEFITQKAPNYAKTRSDPSKDSTSRLSAYFSAGLLSAREAISRAAAANPSKHNFSSSSTSDPGLSAWVRELVFREFYRQTTATTPHSSLNLPQNLKFASVHWEHDPQGWEKWCKGTTGVPLVDAGMRQLNAEAWMHNRARMNVSSYLTCNLLLDYRLGERWFAEHLVDWDLSNNTQGWEPSYTVFNPVSQAERNDPQGEYIRRWVPELRDVQGKAVFDPWERLGEEECKKLGYPKPHVDWRESKERAIARFKSDLADADP